VFESVVNSSLKMHVLNALKLIGMFAFLSTIKDVGFVWISFSINTSLKRN